MKGKIDKNNREGQNWILLGGMFATFMTFVVCWCMQTTFRAMSDWMLYAVNIFATLLFSLPALLSRKVWVQLVIMVLLDCLFISNLMYCRTYFTAIPADSYLLIGNLTDFTASVRDSIRWGDILFPLITMTTGVWAYLSPVAYKSLSRGKVVIWTVVTGVICGTGLLFRGGFYKEYDRLAQSCYYSTCGVPTYTVGGHLLYNMMSDGESITPEVEAEIREWEKEKEMLRPYVSISDSLGRRKNLVIVLLESFESWPIGAKIENKEITPYINSLIEDKNTYYASNVLTQVASGRSIDAQLLIFSGLLPMLNSVYSMKYPDRDYPSLMKAMKKDRNSRNVILTCDKPITWNQEVIARSMGYDTLIDRSAWKHDELIGNPAKLSDGSFLRQSVETLKKDKLGIDKAESYLLTFVTYSGHNPFKLPANLEDPAFKVPKNYPERLRDYVTMAHYTDSKLRVLIDYLRSREDYGETLIVITGDHEGLASDRAELLKTKAGLELVSKGQFTPLIILNSPVSGRNDKMVGQVDIYPTLLTLLGLESYFWKGVGQNILDSHHPGISISSMTGETIGDTTSATPAMLENLRKSRKISDVMIKTMHKL